MSVFDILIELSGTSSRNKKITILQREKNNKLLKEVCRLALDPLTQFHIRKIPRATAHAGIMDLEEAFVNLDKLVKREVTGNAAIAWLTTTLEGLNTENALVIERIISKDLRCGVSTATVNKVWPKLVSDFPCMLASGFEEKAAAKIKYPAIAQLKLDGMRCTAVVKNKNGGVTLYSRNGKEIDVRGILDRDLIALSAGADLAIDGELIVVNENGVEDRQTGNGILNKAIKGTISVEECKRIRYVLFDVLDYYGEFEKGITYVNYGIRFAVLENFFKASSVERLQLVESRYVKNLDEAYEFFACMVNQGEEGIILKDSFAGWEGKRVKHQIKFKAELDTDLLCVGWDEGTGKYENMLGALVLKSACGKLEVSVGTGFSDEQRKTLKPEDCIGKIVVVRYNTKIKDKKTGIESLFLPRFLEIREDKSEPDYAKDIK